MADPIDTISPDDPGETGASGVSGTPEPSKKDEANPKNVEEGLHGLDALQDNTAPRPSRVSRISADKIREIEELFVEPDWFQAAATDLRNKQLLMICGEEGTGKRESATALAVKQSGQAVWYINRRVRWTDLDEFRFEPGNCYVWSGRIQDQTEAAIDVHIKGIQNTLKRIGSFAVLTVEQATEFKNASIHEHTHAMSPFRPEMIQEIVRKILLVKKKEFSLISDGRTAEEKIDNTFSCLDDPTEWQKFIAGSQLKWPREAVRFAQALIEQPTVSKAIEKFQTPHATLVQEWFQDSERTLLDRVGQLALTAFHGLPYKLFIEVVRDLERRLKPSKLKRNSGRYSSDSFLFRREDQMARWQAEIVLEDLDENYGRFKVEIIRCLDPQFQQAMCDYLWSNLDDAQTPYLEWLYQIALNGRENIRLSALEAIAVIACKDYPNVYRTFLEPCVSREDIHTQASAMQVLLYMVTDGNEATQIVQNTADFWMSSRNIHHRWIGGTIHAIIAKDGNEGGMIALRSLAEGRLNLYNINPIEHAVRQKIAHMLTLSYNILIEEGKFERVFLDLENHGDLVFLARNARLSYSLFATLLQILGIVNLQDGTQVISPKILTLIMPQGGDLSKAQLRWRDQLVTLCWRSLNAFPTRVMMRQAIELWFQCCDNMLSGDWKKKLGLVILDLFKRIINNGPDGYDAEMDTRLCDYLDTCSQKSPSAGKVLKHLKKAA